jgi:LPS-assembly protein
VIQVAFAIFLFLGSQQDQVLIRAEGPQVRNGNVWSAEKNVVVTYRDMRLEGDKVTYDEDTHVVTADGHLIYNRADEHLRGDHLSVQVDTKEGDFTNVTGQIGPGFYIKAEHAHRTEDGLYILTKATVTSCCDERRPGWMVAAAKAVVNPHQSMKSSGSVFRLENVPVLYMPYIALPSADRERASGFMIPSTSTSTTKGRGIEERFYWAINRSMDAMFTGEYFTSRGPAGMFDFRAMPKKDSRIQIETLFAHDRQGQGGQSARILAFGELGRGYRGAVDVNLVSSFPFRQVYEDGLNLISSPLTNSVGFLSRNRPDLSTNFLYLREGVFYEDPTTGAFNTVVLQKAPSVELGIPARRWGSTPAYIDGDSSVTGISRRDDVINTPLVGRLDFHPALELPVVRSDLFDLSQHLGVRETAYSQSLATPTTLGSGFNRFSLDYNTHLVGPQLERDFGRFRHIIEPTFDYTYVTGADRFRNTILVDNVDLVTHTNETEYGITNRFFTNREIFSWRVSQKYFLDPTFGGAIIPGRRNVFNSLLDLTGFAFADQRRRFSPIVSTMRLSTTPSTSEDVEVDYDTTEHLFRSAGIIGNANRGLFTGGLSYFFIRRSAIDAPNNQLRASLAYGNRLKPGFSGAITFAYDIENSLFQGSVGEVGYNTNCFGLNFEAYQYKIGARVESTFRFSFTLKDVGSFGTLRKQERLF